MIRLVMMAAVGAIPALFALPANYVGALESAGRGDWPAARTALEQTILSEPGFGPAYRKLGQIAVTFHAAPEATSFFEGLIRTPATASSGYLGLAWLAFDRRDEAESHRLSELAVNLAGNKFPAPYLLWNRTLARRNHTQEAGRYRLWMQREPNAVLPRFTWHHLRAWSGEGSVEDLDRMRQLHGGNRDYVEAWMLAEYQIGQKQRALAAMRETAVIAVQSADPELHYLATNYSVGALRDLGLAREAAIAAERALAEARRFGDRPSIVFLTIQECSIRFDLADPAAERLCRQSADLAMATPGSASVASDSLARLANIAENQGLYDVALKNIESSMDWADRSGFPVVRAIRRLDMALLLLAWGQPARAETLLLQAMDILRPRNQPSVKTETLASLGRCNADLGRPLEARRHFDEALAIATKSGNKQSELVVWREMALASAASGDLPETRRALNEAIRLATALQQRGTLAPLLAGAGHVHARLSQWNEAEARFTESLAAAQDSGQSDGNWQAHFGLGLVAEHATRSADALQHYRRAIEASEQLRSRIPDPAWRAPFFASRQELYHRAVSILAAGKRLPEAFALLERSRARAFLDLTAPPLPTDPRAEPDERSIALAQALSNAERRLWDATMSENGATARETNRLRREAESAGMEYHMHVSRQTRRAGISASENPVSANGIQQALGADTALLSYSIGPARGWLFVVTKDRLAAYPVPPGPVMQARAADLADFLSKPPDRLSTARMSQLLSGLYRSLVAPAGEQLRGRKKWLITVEGALQRVPFGALLESSFAGEFSQAPFLIRRAAISVVPSASAWLRLRERARVPGSLLIAAIADPGGSMPDQPWRVLRSTHTGPLPGARREAEALKGIYAGTAARVEVRVGREATERETLRLLSEARIVHLGVHGFSDSSRPLSSALLLAQSESGGGNGMLQAYEIQRLHLPQLELAVLPACETAAGQQMPGETVQALAGSFLLAGARAVVGSIWRIPDAPSADAMIALHSELRLGAAASQALRAAQLTLIRNPSRAHPYFWAGFQAIGAAD